MGQRRQGPGHCWSRRGPGDPTKVGTAVCKRRWFSLYVLPPSCSIILTWTLPIENGGSRWASYGTREARVELASLQYERNGFQLPLPSHTTARLERARSPASAAAHCCLPVQLHPLSGLAEPRRTRSASSIREACVGFVLVLAGSRQVMVVEDKLQAATIKLRLTTRRLLVPAWQNGRLQFKQCLKLRQIQQLKRKEVHGIIP